MKACAFWKVKKYINLLQQETACNNKIGFNLRITLNSIIINRFKGVNSY